MSDSDQFEQMIRYRRFDRVNKLSESILVRMSDQITIELVNKMNAQELERQYIALARLSLGLAAALVSEQNEMAAKYIQ